MAADVPLKGFCAPSPAEPLADSTPDMWTRPPSSQVVVPPQAPQAILFREINELRKVDRTPPDDDSLKYKDSFFGHLAANKKFEATTFLFIGVNSLYIGMDADYSARTGKPADLWDPNTPVGFVIMENIFCLYFTLELIVRFVGYKIKKNVFTDAWFVFDSILVTFMVLETWLFPIFGIGGQLAQFSVLRLLRLLRISRMARLMKKVPELMIIIKGMAASFRSVGCTAILQVLILYVWSILFVSEYHEKGPDDPDEIAAFFGSMGKSFFSLFIMGTVLDDVTQCTNAIRETGNMFMLSLFIVFILISSFTILNMLIGILCEVVSNTAESEKTKSAEESVKEEITNIFDAMDVDRNGNITQLEFLQMRDTPKVRAALEEMDIYESHFNRYCELLFQSQEMEEAGKVPEINFETLITMIMRLSPGNHIGALDFSLLRATVDKNQEAIRERIMKIHVLVQKYKGDSVSSLLEGDATLSQLALMSEEQSLEGYGNMASTVDMRKIAQGEPPPLPPYPCAAEGVGIPPPSQMVSHSSCLAPSPPVSIFEDYPLDMFVRTSSSQIIEELERRLGVPISQVWSVPPQKDVLPESLDSFHSFGVPQH